MSCIKLLVSELMDFLWLSWTFERHTPLMVIQGTYWWGGFNALVCKAFWCISCIPMSPLTQLITLSMLRSGAKTFRHYKQEIKFIDKMRTKTVELEKHSLRKTCLHFQLSRWHQQRTPCRRWLGKPYQSCSLYRSRESRGTNSLVKHNSAE